MTDRLIGLCGQKQSGKSSSTSYIRSRLKSRVVIERSFAVLLKEFCIETLGLTRKQCGFEDGTEEDKNSLTNIRWENVDSFFRKKYGRIIVDDTSGISRELKTGRMTAREVMQVQGELQRSFFYQDIWVDALFRRINKQQPCDHRMVNVVSDVRHLNEIEKVLSEDGFIIHLLRGKNGDVADSEAELLSIKWNKYDRVYHIDNSEMTIDEKNEEINKILKTEGLL